MSGAGPLVGPPAAKRFRSPRGLDREEGEELLGEAVLGEAVLGEAVLGEGLLCVLVLVVLAL
jgi:hypothetical protein